MSSSMPLTAEETWRRYPPEGEEDGHTVVGNVQVLKAFRSPELENERDIFIYLPASYGSDDDRRYPVIYMQDGQNLFDQALSFGDEWRVDESMEEMGADAIVVGVCNTGPSRIDEYSPFPDRSHGGGRGDHYVRFLTDTLKPRIDHDFRTLPDVDNTGIAGSSMGGLISLYGFFRAPNVFGFAGAMSPSLWFANRAIFRFVERAEYSAGRVYLDVGTGEGSNTVRNARRMRNLLHRRGYDSETGLMYVEEHGAGHTESAWAHRLKRALPFLLPGSAIGTAFASPHAP